MQEAGALQLHDRSYPDPHICSQCDAVFRTNQALRTHVSRAHGMHPLRKATLTNECPFCMHTFSTTRQARRHLGRRIKLGHCPAPGVRIYEVQPVDQ
eukprot:707929-Heterocapsa_arctica.AAC.1